MQGRTTIDGGDHLLFVGRVRRLSYGDKEPLIFYAGKYCTAAPLREISAQSGLEGCGAGWADSRLTAGLRPLVDRGFGVHVPETRMDRA